MGTGFCSGAGAEGAMLWGKQRGEALLALGWGGLEGGRGFLVSWWSVVCWNRAEIAWGTPAVR